MTSATPASVSSTRWTEITAIWRDNRWLFALSGWLLGILTIVALQRLNTDVGSLLVDLVPEAVGIVFTVLIIERFAANRAVHERKLALFRQAKSRSNDVALEAVDQIVHEGWWDELRDYYRNEYGLVDLSQAHWSGGIQLQKANLGHANLQEANLEHADLQYANLEHADLQYANLEHANLQEANLEHANLQEANLEHANLGSAHLEHADLGSAHLEHADLGNARLKNANLQYAHLEHAKLTFAHLEHADLGSAHLEHAYLWLAHLEHADLFAAHLEHAYLGNAHLEYAYLGNASLHDVQNIETAFFNEKTVLPDAKYVGKDAGGKAIFDKYWTPDTDMTRYTNPDHPDFWEPEWVKKEREEKEKKSG